ncbi:hypothetical protein [Pseudarthrobacter sp. YAF2]|uniref:hypothetical protein n=1 Tax=Pseudarthrobacter sp. YAF2 TaxID=3233078 RepID=UPI003F9756D9
MTLIPGIQFPTTVKSPFPLRQQHRGQLVDAVIRSATAVSATAAGSAVSWWMVRGAGTEAGLLHFPDVDKFSPRMLGGDEHRFRCLRYFHDPGTRSWILFEQLMTTIVCVRYRQAQHTNGGPLIASSRSPRHQITGTVI